MRKLTLVMLSLVFLPGSGFAAMCADEISQRPGESRVGNATCPKCVEVLHYARFGGALLQDNHREAARSRYTTRYNYVLVNNGRGSSVFVNISPITNPTGISFGTWFGFELFQANRAVIGVTATPQAGSVSGAPWNRQPTSKGQLRKVCGAIDREKEVREAKDFYKDQLKLGVINFGSFTVGGELNAFSNSAYNRFSTFSSSGLSPHGFPVITTESVF